MSTNFIGKFGFMAAIVAVVIFMIILYGYNRAEKRKLARPQQQPVSQQQQAFQAYRHPNFASQTKKGCSACSAKK